MTVGQWSAGVDRLAPISLTSAGLISAGLTGAGVEA